MEQSTPRSREVIRHLNYFYYGAMALTVAIAALCYFLLVRGIVPAIDPLSVQGQVLQYIVIFSTLLALPGALYLHKRACVRLSAQTDEELQLVGYRRSARLRILVIGVELICSVALYYSLGGYQPMIWLAAIAAIGLYFSKPTERKMFLELQPKDPNAETY